MRGNDENEGIIPLAMKEIFYASLKMQEEAKEKIDIEDNEQQKSFTIRISVQYLEIYNECVNDLLDPQNKNLDIRENKNGGIFIEKLSEFEVKGIEESLLYLKKGD